MSSGSVLEQAAMRSGRVLERGLAMGSGRAPEHGSKDKMALIGPWGLQAHIVP